MILSQNLAMICWKPDWLLVDLKLLYFLKFEFWKKNRKSVANLQFVYNNDDFNS